MKITLSMLMNMVLVTILVASFFLVNSTANTASKYETTSIAEYDPWIDHDDDGDIDLYDAVYLLTRYGMKGDPITKASITYDSGWINITDKAGQYFNVTHNLNSTDIIVDITGKTTLSGGPHQRNIGGTSYTPGWNKTYGGTSDDDAKSVVQTVDGGYVMAGYTYSFGVGGADCWLVKTDSAGNMQWNQTYGGTSDDFAYSVVETSDGGYAIAGLTYSFGVGGRDFWLVRTDSFGNAHESWLFGLVWTDSTADTVILYRGATDACWNYVRVRIWEIKENP